MSRSNSFLVATVAPALCLALGVVAFGAPALKPGAAKTPKSSPEAARLETFAKNEKASYFALSLTPAVALGEAASHDVVVLVDTSASQTGPFREKSLSVLKSIVSGLGGNDRVQLFAVDLDPIVLTTGFVAPNSADMKKALATLDGRVPLGSTDMNLALAAVVKCFAGKSNSARAAIYIGDGMSVASFVGADEFRSLAASLVAQRVAVTSYAIGPRLDNNLLAALANHTGGMLAIDGESVDVKQAAVFLLDAVHGTVAWPTQVAWPKSFAEVYPAEMPPLRADRDSVVIGKGQPTGAQQISMTAEVAGKPVEMTWTVTPGDSNEDYSFLPLLVDSAQKDRGITLPTVGTVGLKETGRLVSSSAQELSRLGSQAIATGNLDSAELLAAEALRRDPHDPSAKAMQQQLQKLRKSGGKLSDSKLDLKLERTSSEQAAPPPEALPPGSAPADDSAASEGSFLDAVEVQNDVIAQVIKTEVENTLKASRSRMAGDPQGTKADLKLELERVRRAPELSSEARAQLNDQLAAAIREAERQESIKDQTDQEQMQSRAAALERLRVMSALESDQERVRQLMDRFNSLMDEGRYREAEESAAVEVQKIMPDMPIAVSAIRNSEQTRYYEQQLFVRNARDKAVLDTLYQSELASIPFPDDQPIVYPDASVWEELTLRRKKYAAVDLKEKGGAEEKIRKALEDTTSIEFVETPLSDVVDYLKDLHNIEIQLDTKALDDASLGSDTPITKNLKGITLRSALRLMLGGMDLTYVIKNEVLMITTVDKANTDLVTKVYPVADLVLPIQQTGFSGGFGGLGGGSAGGGFGQGQGGGGGGFGGGGGGGGFGGGGGGFGGGGQGGGGFFSVPDQLAAAATPSPAGTAKQPLVLGSKKAAAPIETNAVESKAVEPKAALAVPAAEKSKATSVKSKAKAIAVAADKDVDAAWNDYFAAHQETSSEGIAALDAQVRETVRKLMHERKFEDTIALIRSAL